jgi:hypothetical protein
MVLRQLCLAVSLAASVLVAGCANLGTMAPVADKLSAAWSIADVVFDPLSPNWDVKEVRLADTQYQLLMRLKRYHTGGDGEARQIFQRRAAKLARDGGYAGYQIMSYTEGIDSSTLPAAQIVAEGVVLLVGKGPD